MSSTVTHTFSCFELAARTEDEDTHTEVVGLHAGGAAQRSHTYSHALSTHGGRIDVLLE